MTISVPTAELNIHLDKLIQGAMDNIDNEVESDTFSRDKMIRLSTKIKAFKIVKTYINKEE